MTRQTVKCHTAAILLGGHSSRMDGRHKFLLKDREGQSKADKSIGKIGEDLSVSSP